MNTTPAEDHNANQLILKSNLWKFFKALRAQANPIYSLLVGSPIEYASITILDKKDSSQVSLISPGQFIGSLREMPSKDKFYRLDINLCYLSEESQSTCTYVAALRDELSIETIKLLYPRIVAYHCIEALRHGSCFALTPHIIKRFKFKARYIDELQSIIESCNQILLRQILAEQNK